jgi:sigma-54 specific flagellar transcriptional regulator A
VRELENTLRAASLFADGEVITARDLTSNVEDLRLVAAARPRPSLSSVTVAVAPTGTDSAETLDEAEPGETDGPLPQIEATATAVAYAQVRQGCVTLSNMKRQIERDCIARALAETKGNITRAAALLGMKRPRLSQLVKQYGLAAVSSEA